MRYDDIDALVRDACEESKLHASYTFEQAQFDTVAFAVDTVLVGVREALRQRNPKWRSKSAASCIPRGSE